jgi:hypothetical protein
LISISRIGVLSFADVLDGKSAEQPFTNSFTATYHRFSNWLHCDNNYVPIAIGLWWEAECDGPGKKYEFLMDADHNKTKGGEFMWGKFGFGVDFEKYYISFLSTFILSLLLNTEPVDWSRYTGTVKKTTMGHSRAPMTRTSHDGAPQSRLQIKLSMQ